MINDYKLIIVIDLGLEEILRCYFLNYEPLTWITYTCRSIQLVLSHLPSSSLFFLEIRDMHSVQKGVSL